MSGAAFEVAGAEVQARRSLRPQSEAFAVQLDALPPDVRSRFMELFNAYVSAPEHDRAEVLDAIVELLNPESINTNTTPIDKWNVWPPEAISKQLEIKKKAFAARVERRMSELGMTQAVLAEKISVSQGNISQIISGRYKPQPKTLAKLAEVLGIALGELWPDD